MAVVAVAGGLTRAELDALPDDGRRHELIDGAIIMTPSPEIGHQRIVLRLAIALDAVLVTTDLEVVIAPFDVLLNDNVVEPDILVAPSGALVGRQLAAAPRLVVEVRSPSTRWIDEGRKREIYQEAGIPSYWLVDPTTPAITVLELVDGTYGEVATASGEGTVEVQHPAPITVCPETLSRPRRSPAANT